MTRTVLSRRIPCLALAAVILALASQDAFAQNMVQGYSYQETQNAHADTGPLVFGLATYKLCQIKNFLFMAVYVLAAIAFVFFAVKALFTKFEFRAFMPIVGAIFVVAFADLLIAFIAPNAWYCPTTLSQF